MPDSALWTTLISALGAGTSALGAVVITNRGTFRRDQQQQKQRNAERHWAQHSETAAERRAVWSRLLKTAGRVKASSQLLSGGFQPDLRKRVSALHDDAMAVAEEASLVTILYADAINGEQIAAAAQGLATATARLVVELENAVQWERTPDGESPSGGDVAGDVAVADFDARITALQRALAPVTANGDSPPEVEPDGTRPAPRSQWARVWLSRRDASSR
jgi:hypothetical protein